MTPSWLQYGMFWATLAVGVVTLGATLISYFLFRAHVDPDVVVYSKNNDDGTSVLFIVIENVGAGVAYNVRFKLSRPIPRRAFRLERTGQKEFEPMSEGPLFTGIPLLAAGEKRVITWGQFGGLIDMIGTNPVRVTASYESRGASPWDPTDHSTDSLLEVFSFEGTDASEAREIRQLRQLEKIARALESSSRSVLEIAAVMRRPEREGAVPQTQERETERDAGRS